MPLNSYFAIGFGADMVNTDMLLWQATPGSPIAKDMWSSTFSTPQVDTQQNWQTTYSEKGDRVISECRRVFNTGDEFDFAIPQHECIVLGFAGQTGSSDFEYHGSNKGWIAIQLDSNGSITSQDIVVDSQLAEKYARHGWVMWTCWCVLAWTIVASKRYCGGYWLQG